MTDEVRDLDPVAPAPVTGEQAKQTPTEAPKPQTEAEPEADELPAEASEDSASEDVAATEESGESSAEDEDGTEGEKPKKLSRSQRERRAKIRAIERAEFAEREAAELRRQLTDRETRPQQQQPQRGLDPNDPEPSLDDFQNTIDPNGFHKLAHDDWRRRELQRVKESESQRGKEAGERAQKEFRNRLAEFEDDHEERVEQAREVIPDYDKVVKNIPKGVLPPEIVLQIAQSDKSALLQYHFGKNPEALEKISQTAQRDVLAGARELWRIESRLSLPQSKKTTTAPPPLKPPSGGGASPPTDIRKLADMDDITAYAKARDGKKG